MKRSRSIKKYLESSESENEEPIKKKTFSNEATSNPTHKQESSSESDIEDYLLKPEKLNLDSQFYNTNVTEFETVEKNIFSGITQLSDSESNTDEEKDYIKIQEKPSPVKSQIEVSSKMNFKELQDYTIKIEEAKKQIEIYKAKKQVAENQTDILNLLAAGERQLDMKHDLKPEDLHSSDFESCGSEVEDWEEIKTKTTQEDDDKRLLPQSSLQITVDMPTNVKKKKGIDLLAAMKRRLNRIRKENQLLVHKVHLLCWLAHGNYVNSSINDTETLATALSLLPSEQCYPSDRVDLSYLEQIVNWYKRTVKNIEKPDPKNIPFHKCLQLQISRKEAHNKKMLVCIFIAILRALGIQVRIVMSLQVEPLRPPSSELHTVSSKSNEKKEAINQPIKNSKTNSTIVSDKNNKTKPSEIQSTKRSVVKISTPLKKSQNNKELDIDIKKIKKEKTLKKAEMEETIGKNVNSKTLSSKKLQVLINKETVSQSLANNQIRTEEIERETKVNKNNEKLLDVKTERHKPTRSKGTGSKSKSSLTKEENQHPCNIDGFKKGKSLKSKLSLQELNKSFRSKESMNIESKPHNDTKNKKRSTNRVSENYSTKLPSKKNKEKLEKTLDNSGITNDSTEQQNLKNAKSKPLKSTHTKGKDSLPFNTTDAGSSKDVGNNNKRILRTRSKKGIPQVDGIYDTDSDIETCIWQLDGANDKKKQSKSNISYKAKTFKRASGTHRVETSSEKVSESDSDSEFEPSTPGSKKRFSGAVEKRNLKKLTGKPPSREKKLDVRTDIMNLIKGRISEQKQVDQRRLAKKGECDLKNDSDSDYAPEPVKKKYHGSDDDFVPKTKVKRRIQVKKTSVLSDSENESEKNKKKGNDVWIEVFLEAEEKWISVDIVYGQVHCVKEIYQRASHPVSYVVSWDNNNKLKDVTQRYCQNFNTVTRKQRVDPQWWNDSIKPFMGTPTAKDKEEDDDLARQQLDQPLPKSIAEYKNHPLYALKRHLLKFEALYPPEPPTLGFIRGEAVYPRSCVYTLHSRDIWLKQAKVVKLGEEPYKIVKARPKYDRLSNKVITDQTLEIFGQWQVQDYEPPTAENGIVPKNAFGNVDLFKPCMLPKECVHLKLPGLNKIARKMNIDIAAAIVGFDFHGGWSHPVYDGFVVCKEYEEQLISVWELEQDELERKEEEKIDKRVYGNWRKLIKGLLIRERLKAKYDFGEPSTSNGKNKKNKAK